jgi:hypothetical protein
MKLRKGWGTREFVIAREVNFNENGESGAAVAECFAAFAAQER